jgi:hypothetical protein
MPVLKPIPGYPEYMAGDDGRVYSAWKRGGPDRWFASDQWTCMKNKNPSRTCRYPQVGLKRNGAQEWKTVHSLVSLAFHGRTPRGMEISHKDGNACNATPGNLAFKDHLSNCADKVAHGTDNSAYPTIEWILRQIKEAGVDQCPIA